MDKVQKSNTSDCQGEFNTPDYRVFILLYPSSGILKNTTFRKQNLFPSSGEGAGDIYSVGSLRTCKPQSQYDGHYSTLTMEIAHSSETFSQATEWAAGLHSELTE
jgi:hypothetical protein